MLNKMCVCNICGFQWVTVYVCVCILQIQMFSCYSQASTSITQYCADYSKTLTDWKIRIKGGTERETGLREEYSKVWDLTSAPVDRKEKNDKLCEYFPCCMWNALLNDVSYNSENINWTDGQSERQIDWHRQNRYRQTELIQRDRRTDRQIGLIDR